MAERGLAVASPGVRSGMFVPAAWTVVAAGVAGLTIAGPLPVALGLAAMGACVVVASSTLVAQRGAAQRRAQAHEVALSIGGDGVWDYDLRTGAITYDDRCAQMLGYDRGHVADHLAAWGKLVHPEDLIGVRKALDDYLAGRSESYDTRVRLQDARGCWRTVVDRGRIVERAADGKPLRMIGIHREVQDLPAPTVETVVATSVSPTVVVDPPAPGTTRPTTVRAAIVALRAELQYAAKDARAADNGRADALRRRLQRLERWEAIALELVPLAALVDDFAAPHVDIALDLPIADADPTLLHEVLALVMDVATGAPTGRRKVAIRGAPCEAHRARIRVVGAGLRGIDGRSARLRLAGTLVALIGGTVVVGRDAIDIEVRSPMH